MRYGPDLERLGADTAPEMWRRYGARGLVRLLADVALQVPGAYADELRQDVRYALRRLRGSPGFVVAATASLAIGIGVSAVSFWLVNEAVFRLLPGATRADRLYTLGEPVSYQDFQSLAAHDGIATDVAALIGPVPFNVMWDGESPGSSRGSDRVSGHIVSPSYFRTLGVTPSIGRLFTATTEAPGGPPVVVLSERFWRTRFDADPGLVGRTIRVNGQPATIVGVGPTDFRGVFPINPADLFVPATSVETIAPELLASAIDRTDQSRFRLVLRLRDDVTPRQAEAALDVAWRNLKRDRGDTEALPAATRRTVLGRAGGIVPITDAEAAAAAIQAGVLITLILSLTCANLAGLMLERGGARRTEVAVRLSVGASRARLVRQFLVEAGVLGLAGGAAGLVMVAALFKTVGSIDVPGTAPGLFDLHIDLTLATFVALASIAAALGFGLLPAMATTRVSLAPGVRSQGSGVTRRFGLRNLFVAYQVCVATALLLLVGFVIDGYRRALNLDKGFTTSNVYVLSVDPGREGHPPAVAANLIRDLPARLRKLPGIDEVSIADRPPFSEAAVAPGVPALVAGADGGESRVINVGVHAVGAGYFATLGVPVVSGRELNARDLSPSDLAIPIVLNQSAAALLAADSPIGRELLIDERQMHVVGVVRDTRPGFLVRPSVPMVYRPLQLLTPGASEPSTTGLTFGVVSIVWRSQAGATAIEAVRRELDSGVRITAFDVRSLDDQIARSNLILLSVAAANSGMGGFAAILAAIGLAGIAAQTARRRRREIGIRMALGARRTQVVLLVGREAAILTLAGCAAGVGAALAVRAAALSSIDPLREVLVVSLDDPRLLAGTIAAVAVLATLACLPSVRRSARLDPAIALRDPQ